MKIWLRFVETAEYGEKKQMFVLLRLSHLFYLARVVGKIEESRIVAKYEEREREREREERGRILRDTDKKHTGHRENERERERRLKPMQGQLVP